MNTLLFTLLLVSPVACRSVPADPTVAFVVQDAGTATSVASGNGDGYTQLTVQDDDKGELLLVMHDKRITALLDGEVLPAERVTRDGDKLSVKDAGGKVLYEVRVLDDSHSLIYPYNSNYYVTTANGVDWGSAGGAYALAGTRREPRKLIGVTTAAVDAGLRKQLGLQGDAFMIATVNEDMPAARAGAEPYDVVTAIDGDAGASGEKLRDVLEAKEPGQTLTLTVLREGKPMELTLTVEEPRFSNSFWPSAVTTTGDWPQPTVWRNSAENADALRELLKRSSELDAQRELLTTQLAELQAHAGGTEAARTENARRLAELAAQQERVSADQAALEADLVRRSAETALLQGSANNRWLMLPSKVEAGMLSGNAAGGPVVSEERYKQLEERLARLEALLEKLAAQQPAATQSAGEPPK